MRPIGIALLLVVAALTGCSGGTTTADPAPVTTTTTAAAATTAAQSPAQTAGCEFYQAADAKAVLNAELRAARFTDNEPGNTNTKFNSCVYWTTDDLRYANVGYRRPLTEAGAADNRSQFKNQRTGDAVAIAGLGNDAYWDTPNGQILVLTNDALLVISTGVKDKPAAERSRPDTEKLATLVLAHLPK